MTRRRLAAVVAAAAAIATSVALPEAAGAKTVRVFAVGPKFSLDWVVSRATYHDKLFALADRTLRVPPAPAIQDGADDVAGHLLGPSDPRRPAQTARDLVVLPEDIGLPAAFTGSRGAGARAATGLVSSVGSLLASYAGPAAYYANRFPVLKQRPVRGLTVALTDTFGRVGVETFAELARRYRVYLEAGIDMVRDWRIVCSNRATFRPPPGAERCDEQDPAKVAALRDPDEPARDYAYEATAPEPVNMALVFDPEGRLISRQVKSYLTPIELPGVGLDLVPGEVSGLRAVRTPVGTLGFVTSKDAWMPDVTQKLDQQHVDLLVQPEFFVGDTVSTKGPWAPDVLKAAGYSDVLRHPSIGAMALPELTGNLYDFPADAQSHIAIKPRGSDGGPAGFLVGQDPAPGLATVARWLVPDPARPGEPIAERRHRLGLAGQAAGPSSAVACASPRVAGPCRGGQVEDVVWRDVEVARSPRRGPAVRRRRARTPFSVNRPISPSSRPQRNVALAARGRHVWAAFEERVRGRDQVYLVRSADGGRHWGARTRPTGRRTGRANEWWPSVAAGPGGRVWVAWGDDSSGTMRVYLSASRDGGRSFGAPIAIGRRAPRGAAQWKPQVAAIGDGALVEWIDERARSADDDLPQAGVYVARVRGRRVSGERRLDGAKPAENAAKLANAWAPSLAVRGRAVLATWVDFHTYDWRVYSRGSRDAGRSWGPTRQVSQAPTEPGESAPVESIDDSPRAALGDRGPLVTWTDFRKDSASATRPSPLYDIDIATPGGRNRQVDGNGARQVDSFSPAIVPQPRGAALVAWQDHARGTGAVLIARVRAGRGGGRAVRVQDASAAPWNAWRPALALAGREVVAAWEDERDGPPQAFAAAARASAIR